MRIVCLLVCTGVFIASLAAVVEAGDLERRYLAIDQSLHEQLIDMDMVMGQADRQRVILRLDQEWEIDAGFVLAYITSITRDPSGQYRMYYMVRRRGVSPGQAATAVAFSDDGIHWTKPALNLSPHLIDHPQSNLIYVEPHDNMRDGWPAGEGAIYDEHEGDYKFLWIGGGFNVARSEDGLSFQTTRTVFRHKSDTNHCFFYDSRRQEYMIYGRIRGARPRSGTPGYWTHGQIDRRGIPLHRSPTWDETEWSNVGQVVADPLDVWMYTTPPEPDGTGPDLYVPNIQPYHGQYIGLPSVYYRDGRRIPFNRPERTTGTGEFYSIVMHSHDGENWSFPDPWHSITDLTPHRRVNTWVHATNRADPEVGQISLASNFIEKEDTLLIYYMVRDDTHYEGNPGVAPTTYNVAFLRVDGFASLQPFDGATGQWLTSAITIPQGANNLIVNANVPGSLRVEILDAATEQPIEGFTLRDSQPFSEDEIRAVMRWRDGQVQSLVGREVRLRFTLTGGAIYSFSFAGE